MKWREIRITAPPFLFTTMFFLTEILYSYCTLSAIYDCEKQTLRQTFAVRLGICIFICSAHVPRQQRPQRSRTRDGFRPDLCVKKPGSVFATRLNCAIRAYARSASVLQVRQSRRRQAVQFRSQFRRYTALQPYSARILLAHLFPIVHIA